MQVITPSSFTLSTPGLNTPRVATDFLLVTFRCDGAWRRNLISQEAEEVSSGLRE